MVTVLAYADDLVLIAPTSAGMQQLLNIVKGWCTKWRLTVNKDKTKIMHVRPKRVEQSGYAFTYGEQSLSKVEKYKYLGFTVGSDGNILEGSDILAKSAERALGSMITKIRKNGDVGVKTFIKLYMGCVVSIMDYCGGVWGIRGKDQRKLIAADKVQGRAQRFFLGVDKRSPKLGYEGDLPLPKASDRRLLHAVRFYNYIRKLDESRLVKRMYEVGRKNFRGSWASELGTAHNELGMSLEWEHQSEINVELVRKKLQERDKEKWKAEILLKPKLRTYCIFKKEVKIENHVTSNLPKKSRSLIQRLRIGTLPLEIERGRFSHTPLDQRICKICNNGIEDECHLLFDCPAYTTLRKEWLEKTLTNDRTVDLTAVFEKPYALAKFLTKALEKRQSSLNTK